LVHASTFARYSSSPFGSAHRPSSAVYGAQAAEIFLDAIARSDGTRASVTRELFETRVEDGLLGNISFDR
jgi:hypothetical protein